MLRALFLLFLSAFAVPAFAADQSIEDTKRFRWTSDGLGGRCLYFDRDDDKENDPDERCLDESDARGADRMNRLLARDIDYSTDATDDSTCGFSQFTPPSGCADPNGPWMLSPLHWGTARAPAAKPDRGANPDENNAGWTLVFPQIVDSQNDFVSREVVAEVAAYRHTLVNSEAQGQEGSIEVPEAAGDVLCRNNSTPFASCRSGASCGSVPSVGYPEQIIIKKVPETRYYLATIASVSGCNSSGNKTLTLSDGWPIATDNNDQFEMHLPDGAHPGEFGNAWYVQNIIEARRELYYQPRTNLIPDGRAEDCDNTWTASAPGTIAATADYNPIAKSDAAPYGSVMGGACRWVTGAAGATLTSGGFFPPNPDSEIVVRWHQRSPLSAGNSVGIRILYDSNADGIADTDICEVYTGGICFRPMEVRIADHPDLPLIDPTDPDGGGAIGTGFFLNNSTEYDGFCNDWCWGVARIKLDGSVYATLAVQFQSETNTTVGIDEVIAFPAPTGPVDLTTGMHWLIPPGKHEHLHLGDSRCSELPNTGFGLPAHWPTHVRNYMVFGPRAGLTLNTQTGCVNGAMANEWGKWGIGCAGSFTGACGLWSVEDPLGVQVTTAPPKKNIYSLVTTAVGLDDALFFYSRNNIAQAVESLRGSSRSTRLTTAITATEAPAQIVVADNAGFPPRGRVLIGQEIWCYHALSGGTGLVPCDKTAGFDTLIKQRGLQGTQQVAHAVGESVRLISTQQIFRDAGVPMVINLGPVPYWGRTDGPTTSNYCDNADASAQDCAEFMALYSQQLELMSN